MTSKNDLIRLTAHLDRSSAEGDAKPHLESLSKITNGWAQNKSLYADAAILKKVVGRKASTC
ncbi:hypothetical protein OS31_34420 [Dickeya oryzae]